MYRKILETTFLRATLLTEMLEFCYVAWPNSLLSSLFKLSSQDPKWPNTRPEDEPKKYIEKYLKKNLLQNHLAQVLEIWYEALSSFPLPSFYFSNEGHRIQNSPYAREFLV